MAKSTMPKIKTKEEDQVLKPDSIKAPKMPKIPNTTPKVENPDIDRTKNGNRWKKLF